MGASSGEGFAFLVIPGTERSDRTRLERANAFVYAQFHKHIRSFVDA